MRIMSKPETKRKFQAIGWAVLVLLALPIVAFGLLWVVTSHNEKQVVLNQGISTTGTITARYDSWGDKGPYVTIKYTFFSSDREIVGKYSYEFGRIPSNLNIGTQIEILYNPQKPSLNLPSDARENEKWSYIQDWPMLIFVAIILCGLATFFGYKARSLWRLSRNKIS